MGLEVFTYDSIGKMDDGRIRTALEMALQRCIDDCRDRPGLKTARKLTLQLSLVPVMDDQNGLDSVDMGFVIHETAPKRKTKTFNMRAASEKLLFNEVSPDDARQRTIDELAQSRGEEEKA